MGDADLVERARGGDTAAFGELVRKHQDRVYNTCWRMCGDRTDAEDLTQEAFVKAFQALEGFSGRSQFYTWLFRIAVNLVLSARRRAGRATVYSLDTAHGSDAGGDGRASAIQPAAADPPPGDRAATNEQAGAVLQALHRLDEEHRAVVVLRDLEGLGYDEIGEILGVPAGTVKSRLHRARLALRNELAPLFEGVRD